MIAQVALAAIAIGLGLAAADWARLSWLSWRSRWALRRRQAWWELGAAVFMAAMSAVAARACLAVV